MSRSRTADGASGGGADDAPRRLLIANEERWRADELAGVLAGLGHAPHVVDVQPGDVLAACVRLDPDLVLVGRAGRLEDDLALVAAVAGAGSWPVVAHLPEPDPAYVREIARRGAFTYAVGADPGELEAALSVALERFSQYRALQAAFARRAVIERAKGVLMARQGLDEEAAFDLLRSQARRTSRRVVDLAEAVLESHQLLAPTAVEEPLDPDRVPG
jgi:response regulator NasT